MVTRKDPSPDLLPRIRAAYAQGRAGWPSLTVSETEFADRLQQSLSSTARPAAALDALHAADLYLACACARSDPRALAELEPLFAASRSAIEKVLGSSLWADDTLQQVRRKVVTAIDGPARIAEYSGRGPLKAWIRTIATRAALDMKRAQHDATPPDDEVHQMALQISSPELSLVKAADRPRFETAFAHALEALGPRERNALRLSVLEGMSLEEVGRAYGVNKSTVSRWLAQARTDVLAGLRQTLAAELRLRGKELHSFIGMFQSRLDANLERILGPGVG
jgi:RNA polymerase sigma-70 factor (ECF subfamily)